MRRIGQVVFGTDTRQRRLLTVLMLTALIYSVCLGVMAYGAHAGIFALTPMYIMGALIVISTGLANCEASTHVAGVRVLFSAGLSRYREGEAIASTIERADRAVYAAKAAGRDRTVAL